MARKSVEQREKLLMVEKVMDGLWEEILNGEVEDGLLQTAVNIQILTNRIVWRLNDMREV